MPWELFTVADDEAVAFDGDRVARLGDLRPDTAYQELGLEFRTLPRPPGERLATVATVNDVHFGETECGRIDGTDIGPVLGVGPGEQPYPEVMNTAAAREIAAVSPDAVVAKGDLTDKGAAEEYGAFLACYGAAFGDRLHVIVGNHDLSDGAADPPPALGAVSTEAVVLPGVILALVDTSVPGRPHGRLTADQLDWLDAVAADADRPVMILGHHPCWDPGSPTRPADFFGINPDDSEALVALVARRPAVAGYFAGHTHRNHRRQFAATGDRPWVEVAATKDFPGSWAEYRVFEGGILQIHRRIAEADALCWSENCRRLIDGVYPLYALGELHERCFAFATG